MVTAEEVNEYADGRWKIDVKTKVQSQDSGVDDVVAAFRNSTNVWVKRGRWFDELNARGEVSSVGYVAAFQKLNCEVGRAQDSNHSLKSCTSVGRMQSINSPQ